MDKFEEKEILKKRSFPIKKNTWCNWLINYIPELIKMVDDIKDKVTSKPTCTNNAYGGGKK